MALEYTQIIAHLHGMRRAKFRGLQKIRVQNYMSAIDISPNKKKKKKMSFFLYYLTKISIIWNYATASALNFSIFHHQTVIKPKDLNNAIYIDTIMWWL